MFRRSGFDDELRRLHTSAGGGDYHSVERGLRLLRDLGLRSEDEKTVGLFALAELDFKLYSYAYWRMVDLFGLRREVNGGR